MIIDDSGGGGGGGGRMSSKTIIDYHVPFDEARRRVMGVF